MSYKRILDGQTIWSNQLPDFYSKLTGITKDVDYTSHEIMEPIRGWNLRIYQDNDDNTARNWTLHFTIGNRALISSDSTAMDDSTIYFGSVQVGDGLPFISTTYYSLGSYSVNQYMAVPMVAPSLKIEYSCDSDVGTALKFYSELAYDLLERI